MVIATTNHTIKLNSPIIDLWLTNAFAFTAIFATDAFMAGFTALLARGLPKLINLFGGHLNLI
jgi:hypothetical protein